MKTAEEFIKSKAHYFGEKLSLFTPIEIAQWAQEYAESYYKERSSKDAELTERLANDLEDTLAQLTPDLYKTDRFKEIKKNLTAYKKAKKP